MKTRSRREPGSSQNYLDYYDVGTLRSWTSACTASRLLGEDPVGHLRLASRPELPVELQRKCDHSHDHDAIIGGPDATTRTGRYTENSNGIIKGVMKMCCSIEVLDVDEVSDYDPEEIDSWLRRSPC